MTAEDLRQPSRRRALAVLVGDYDSLVIPNLSSPAKDGGLIRATLGDTRLGGFEVATVDNPSLQTLRKSVYEHLCPQEAVHEEFVFLYISAHGLRDLTGNLFICARDTDPDQLPLSGFSGEELRDWIERCRAERVVVVLDCCYAGAMPVVRQRGSDTRIVISTAGAAELAHEGEGTQDRAEGSAFAKGFFEGIRSGAADGDDNGWITVREAVDHASHELATSGRNQHPAMRGGFAGDAVLSRSPERVDRLPPELELLLRSKLPRVRSTVIDELADLLLALDSGEARSAERALVRLRLDQDERVAAKASRVLAGLSQGPATLATARPDSGAAPDPQWYRSAVFYEIQVRTFMDSNDDGIGDLQGLRQRLPYLQRLGVDALVLSPIFDSPLEDDGYDIADFGQVHASLGDLHDLVDLLQDAHSRGMKVVLDVVLNHTSRRHSWFEASRADPDGSFADFYVWSESDAGYADATVSDQSEASWSYDSVRKQYYWHRFEWFEPDLNFDSTAVQEAVQNELLRWLRLGVDGLRLLTVEFLFEEEGHESVGLQQTHQYLQRLRAAIDQEFDDKILIASVNDRPSESLDYFGSDDFPECHVVLNLSIISRIFLAMARQSHQPISSVLGQMKMVSKSGRWGIFLRNADPLDLSHLSAQERRYLLDTYGPSERMHTPGDLGLRRRLAPLLDGNHNQLEMCIVLLLSLPGAPFLYYGDEIGVGDNLSLRGTAALRTPMPWSPDRGGGFSRSEPDMFIRPLVQDSTYGYQANNVELQTRSTVSLLQTIRHRIDIRRESPALSLGNLELVESSNPAVLAYLRRSGRFSVLCVINFSGFPQATELTLKAHRGLNPVEMLGHGLFPAIGDSPYPVSLNGHGTYWLNLSTP